MALLTVALWQRSSAVPEIASFGEPTVPLRTGAIKLIDGWEGRIVRGEGAPLVLRLEPLHPDAARQAFDAEVLGRMLHRLPGRGSKPANGGNDARTPAGGASRAPEPWRLTLSVAVTGATDGGLLVEDLRRVRLDGLVPIVPDEALEPSVHGIFDPLATAFASPAVPLSVGEECHLIYWGLRPEGSVRASVPLAGAGVGHDSMGVAELMAKGRSANQSSQSIARLDARSPKAGGEERR